MTRRILAIDPGSFQVGAYWGEGRSKTLHLYDTGKSKAKIVATPRPARLSSLATQLYELLDSHPIYFVVYEEQFVRGGAATKALFGAVGVIECVAHTCGAGVMSVPQSTLRKWALSKLSGLPKVRTAKELYSEVAASYADTSRMTEHEKDACVLWNFVQEEGQF